MSTYQQAIIAAGPRACARPEKTKGTEQALKKFEASAKNKNRHTTSKKRQANPGLEGILREGRGHWPIAFPYQKNIVFLTIL